MRFLVNQLIDTKIQPNICPLESSAPLRPDGRPDGQTNGRTDGQTNGRMDGQTNVRTDGQWV